MTHDNTIIMEMVRSSLFAFYITAGIYCLIINKKKLTYKYLLSTILFIWGLELFKDAVSQQFGWFTEIRVRDIYLLSDLLVIPLCAMFVLTMLYKKYITPKIFLQHVLPFIICPIIYATTGFRFIYFIGLAFPVAYGIIVIPKIFRGIKRYELAIVNNYSYQENINVRWLRTVVILLALTLVFCIYTYTNVSCLLFYLYYAYCALTWIYIIFMTERLERPKWSPEAVIVPADTAALKEEALEKITTMTAPVSAGWNMKLQNCFEKEELFLNQNLTMQDVAIKIGTNRTYLSIYLNKKLHTTFYDYVNSYRLKYAENMLTSCNDKIIDISQKSGFNNLSTFTSYFKKKNGCTPKEFRNRYRANNY